MTDTNPDQKTITRADITEAVYKELGFPYTECSDLVESVLEEVCKILEEKDVIKISSFGRLEVKQKKARVGRNPKTKQEAPISARKVISFYASNLLKKQINDNLASS